MEKQLRKKNNGFFHLFLGLIFILSPLLLLLWLNTVSIVLFIIICVVGVFWLFGLMIVPPNKTKVLLFFGKYKGTIVNNGFFWLNPFFSVRTVSLRVRNLESDVIKVNDEVGNPIMISAVVVWKVVDTYKAVFDIEAPEHIDMKTGVKKINSEETYKEFVKIQAEAALRKIAHSYPYDDLDEEKHVLCLRSGGDKVNHALETEIKERLSMVGIEVLEARISNLSYAPEIAAVMLQRQQAQAVIAARKKIVDGAVGMVDMALEKISDNDIVKMDEVTKASMVSNLMMVLCSDQNVTPIVNAGSVSNSMD